MMMLIIILYLTKCILMNERMERGDYDKDGDAFFFSH